LDGKKEVFEENITFENEGNFLILRYI